MQNPNEQQKKDTRWRDGKIFVVYFGTREIGALLKDQVKRWPKKAIPHQGGKDYRTALDEAVLAVAGGAPV